MKERFSQLTRREQIVVIAGGVILSLLLIIRLIWWPLLSTIERLHQDIDNEAELITWMGPRLAQLSQGESAHGRVEKSVSQLERSFKEQGIQSHVQHFAVGEQQWVTIILSEVPIPLFLKWLDAQATTGWQVEQATLTPAPKTGTGDVTMVLK